MIKYDLNTINDWNFGDDNIIKVYRNNAVCYYKITGGGDTPTAQTPCFAVVDDISQYSDTEFEDVFNNADGLWYKLNNLNQYEEYGIYGSGRTITTYDGKLTIDDGYEYMYSGGSWINVGEVSGSTIQTVWYDPASTNASFSIGHYWGTGYKMVFNTYLSGSYGSNSTSFWTHTNQEPIEFMFYSNGFFYDMHNPTSTSSPDVYTGDYNYRIMKNNTLRNYQNGQILNVILTYGTVRVELEDGTAIVTGSTSVASQSWYNGLYLPKIQNGNSNNKCHLSRIQVYNASNELVNDLKFVKNNGVTGSQEISMYDSVLNVTYNNTNSNTPSYHIVSESGGTEYPIYYDEIQDPPNNLTFSSMAEAEAYECPWVGMKATIDGDKYVFSGDSQSGYEWVYNPSRLPQGYTEVEYISSEDISESVLGPYIDTNYKPTQNTRFVIEYQSTTNTRGYQRIFGSGEFDMLGYLVNIEGKIGTSGYYYYKFGQTSSWYTTNVQCDLNRHVIDYNNSKQFLVDNVSIATLPNTSFTCSSNLGIFWSINTKYTTNNINFIGRIFSAKVYENGILVRDFVPCISPNNVVGMYDIVNDVFYSSANSYSFTAGNPV